MPNVELIHGRVKATALRRVLDDARQIVIVSAFTTQRGLDEVRKPVLDCVKRGGSATLLLGLDRAGITSSEVVNELASMMKKAGPALDVFLVVESGRSFLHAKIFAARKKGACELLVGSFNLTGSGISTNHELAAKIVGNAGTLFDDLARFVDSVEEKTRLSVENAAIVAKALERGNGVAEDPEVREQRRRAAAERLEKLQRALEKATGSAVRADQVSTWLSQLLASGGFWAYEFDLEKLSIPSGLVSLYDHGLLLRERRSEAGTATMKTPTAASASFALVPPHLQRLYSRLAKQLGKAFRACGFETPFGFWVPKAYLGRLQRCADSIASRLPDADGLDVEVRAFVAKHRDELDRTIDEITRRAAKDGVRHPSHWKPGRNADLAALKKRLLSAPEGDWMTSKGHTEAVDYIRQRLLMVASKLDADHAIVKLKRVRPELVPVPVELEDPVVRRLLACMIWSVAEDRGTRNTKPAVRELSMSRRGRAQTFADLHVLSEALLDGEDGAEQTFFTAFGRPPYWNASTEPWDDDDDDDDDDE